MAPNATERKRHVRTPAEIAQADLDAANDRVEAATKRVERAEAEVESAKSAHTQAVRRRDYAAKHPDLPEQEADDNPVIDTPAPLA